MSSRNDDIGTMEFAQVGYGTVLFNMRQEG